MRSIRILVGAILLAGSIAWLALGQANSASAQNDVTVNATVNNISEVSFNTTSVTLGTANPGETLTVPGAFTVTVKSNSGSGWKLITRASADKLSSGSNAIPISKLQWGMNGTYNMCQTSDSEVMKGDGATSGTSQLIDLKLDVPSTAAPGAYTGQLAFILQ